MIPRIVVVSGPSGVGKTTVCDLLLERKGFERVVTATTRSPRDGEEDGVDYLFLTDAEFLEWIEEDLFIEWANVHGHRYGSPHDQAVAILERGRHALLNIDVQGAASIQRGSVLKVFLLPPSPAELERRLRGRGTDDPDEIARRLETAKAELARQDEFDLKVVNDDARRAADEIAAALDN